MLRLTNLLNTAGARHGSRGEMLQLSNGREEFQIPLGQIKFVKAASNYVEIHAEARRYLVYVFKFSNSPTAGSSGVGR